MKKLITLIFIVSLAFAPMAKASRNVVYGVNDGNFTSVWKVMAPRIAGLGITQIGVWVRYRCPGDTDYADDRLVRGLPDDLGQVPRSQPIMLQLIGARSCSPHTNKQRRRYAQAALKLVRRYNVKELQVWNEPDLEFWQGTPLGYVRLLAATHDALRGTGVKVIGPGFSPHGSVQGMYTNFTTPAFAIAVKTFYYMHPRRRAQVLDGFAYHPYWSFDNKSTGTLARILDSEWKGIPQHSPRRGLRFWWTETGTESVENSAPANEFGPGNGYSGNTNYWPTYLNMMGDEQFQAARVARVAMKARSNPLIAADFNLQLGDDANLNKWQSGLFRVGGIPKPAYAAFKSAIALAKR